MTNKEILTLHSEMLSRPIDVDPDETFVIDGKKCRVVKTKDDCHAFYRAKANDDGSYTLFMLYEISDISPSRCECKDIRDAKENARYNLLKGAAGDNGLPLKLLLRGKVSANYKTEYID